MAPAPPRALAAALLLLLLCAPSSSAAATPQPPDAAAPPPDALTQLRSAAASYLGRAGDLLGSLDLPSAHQQIRDAYEKGSKAVRTYADILTDQLYHWWQGEQ